MKLQSLTATDPGGTLFLNYQYTYDSIGNILTKATEYGNYTYGYDAVSRLISADNSVLVDEVYTGACPERVEGMMWEIDSSPQM